MKRRWCWSLAGAWMAVMIACPPPARSADVTVDFEDLPGGTAVTAQYADVGGPGAGVVFGESPLGTLAGVQPKIELVASGAASGTHVLGITQPTPPEFPRYGIWGKFPNGGKHLVRLSIGAPVGEPTRSVVLAGVDAAGNDVPGASYTATVIADGTHATPLFVYDALGRIAFFKLVEQGQGAPGLWQQGFAEHTIDDLMFDVPDTTPTPDFSLLLDLAATAGLPLSVSRGGTSAQAARVVVNRTGGSAGALLTSAVGLPSGVTMSVVANSQSNPTEFQVRLSATAAASIVVNGSFTFVATPTGAGVGPAPRSVVIPFSVVENYDLTVTGIDVTQGIQREQALPPRPAAPGGAVPYAGMPLVRNKKTHVRVFAVVATPAGATVEGAAIRLYGRSAGGTPLPGSPLATTIGGALANGNPAQVSLGTLETGTPAATFTLPPAWTQAGTIELEAKVAPPTVLFGGATECCPDNDGYRLTGIPFTDTGFVNVSALLLTGSSQPFPGFPDEMLAAVQQTLPLADGELRTGGDYRAVVDVTPILNATTWGDLFPNCVHFCSLPVDKDKFLIGYSENFDTGLSYCGTFAFKNPNCPDVVMGLVDSPDVAGLSRGDAVLYRSRCVTNMRRPLTSIAHELVHGLGPYHASDGCGGADNDQKADSWPNGWGGILGVGYDVRTRRVLYTGDADANKDGAKNEGAPANSWLDFMSYCANVGCQQAGCGGEVDVHSKDTDESLDLYPFKLWDSWISTKNWARLHDTLQVLKAFRLAATTTAAVRAAAEAPEQPGLSVRAVEDDGAVVVTRVAPGPVRLTPPLDGTTRLVLRDASGAMLAETLMTIESSEGHGGAALFYDADVPLGVAAVGMLPPELARIEIETDGVVRGGAVRSATPPTVQLGRPPRRLGKRKTAVIRWRSADADGDRLTAMVDYSADDGATWRVVYAGPDAQRVRLPAGLFSASRTARLRVRVNDGFDEAVSVSDSFVAPGHRPSLRILSPGRGERYSTNDVVFLEALTYDDGFASLAGDVEWLDGRRPIATGSPASVANLRPGRHRIRAVVRDGNGRKARASVRIKVVRAAALPPETPTTSTIVTRTTTTTTTSSSTSSLPASTTSSTSTSSSTSTLQTTTTSSVTTTTSVTSTTVRGCTVDTDCTDEDLCNVDVCDAGTCAHFMLDCPINACLIDAYCDPGTGECIEVPKDCGTGTCDPQTGRCLP